MDTSKSYFEFTKTENVQGHISKFAIYVHIATAKVKNVHITFISSKTVWDGVTVILNTTSVRKTPLSIRESPFIILNRTMSYLYFDSFGEHRETLYDIVKNGIIMKNLAKESSNKNDIIAHWAQDGKYGTSEGSRYSLESDPALYSKYRLPIVSANDLTEIMKIRAAIKAKETNWWDNSSDDCRSVKADDTSPSRILKPVDRQEIEDWEVRYNVYTTFKINVRLRWFILSCVELDVFACIAKQFNRLTQLLQLTF